MGNCCGKQDVDPEKPSQSREPARTSAQLDMETQQNVPLDDFSMGSASPPPPFNIIFPQDPNSSWTDSRISMLPQGPNRYSPQLRSGPSAPEPDNELLTVPIMAFTGPGTNEQSDLRGPSTVPVDFSRTPPRRNLTPPPPPPPPSVEESIARLPTDKVTPEEIRECGELLREVYKLNVHVSSLEHVYEANKPIAEDYHRKAHGALADLKRTVEEWQYAEDDWTAEELEVFFEIGERINEMKGVPLVV